MVCLVKIVNDQYRRTTAALLLSSTRRYNKDMKVVTTLSIQNLGLRPAQLKALDRKARHRGKSSQEYVRWLIERDLLADKSFDEILKPIREDFRKNGTTEDELERIVNLARRPAHRKRRIPRR